MGSETTPLPAGRVVEVPGRGQTFVREAPGGPGAPNLLLLHGWTTSADINWFQVFDAAAGAGFRVLAPDLRGHRGAFADGPGARLQDVAEDVAELLMLVGADRVIVAGYSMGAAVAQLLARDVPGPVAGLVLSGCGPRFCCTGRERLRFAGLALAARLSAVAPAVLTRAVAMRIYRGLYGDDGFQAWVNRQVATHDWPQVLALGAHMDRFDARGWLPRLSVPAAVVVTGDDRYAPVRRQLELAALLGATVHTVDGDHAAVLHRPEAYLPAFLEACRSVAARADARAGGPGGAAALEAISRPG